jgi:hypothetical protein
MNANQAYRLSVLIVDTWPAGTRGYIWRDVVEPLDHDQATSAYQQLRAEILERWGPTPGQFLARYRQLHDHRPAGTVMFNGAWLSLEGARRL